MQHFYKYVEQNVPGCITKSESGHCMLKHLEYILLIYGRSGIVKNVLKYCKRCFTPFNLWEIDDSGWNVIRELLDGVGKYSSHEMLELLLPVLAEQEKLMIFFVSLAAWQTGTWDVSGMKLCLRAVTRKLQSDHRLCWAVNTTAKMDGAYHRFRSEWALRWP